MSGHRPRKSPPRRERQPSPGLVTRAAGAGYSQATRRPTSAIPANQQRQTPQGTETERQQRRGRDGSTGGGTGDGSARGTGGGELVGVPKTAAPGPRPAYYGSLSPRLASLARRRVHPCRRRCRHRCRRGRPPPGLGLRNSRKGPAVDSPDSTGVHFADLREDSLG